MRELRDGTPDATGQGRLAHVCLGNRQTGVVWAAEAAGLVPSAYRRLTQADPKDQRASGEVRCQREKLSMTLEKKYKFGSLERTRGTWPSPTPYSLELQRPVGESHLETMEKSKAM